MSPVSSNSCTNTCAALMLPIRFAAKFVHPTTTFWLLPYSNQSNLLRFECWQFLTVFWLYLIFYIFFFLRIFPYTDLKLRYSIMEKEMFKKFWKLIYCKISVLFLKKTHFLGIFRLSLFLYMCIFFWNLLPIATGYSPTILQKINYGNPLEIENREL